MANDNKDGLTRDGSHDTVNLLTAENKRLSDRQGELLLLIRKLSAATPYQEEMDGWLVQRASMIAEIGTLRAKIKELELERDSWRKRAAQHGCNTEDGDHECG